MNKKLKLLLVKLLHKLVLSIGVLSLIFILLALTDLPYKAYHALSISKQTLEEEADVIVIMGGDGMPSPNGLMRVYHAALLAKEYPKANIIIALPYNDYDSTKQLDLMKKALLNSEVEQFKIKYASKGYNTRTQALEIAEMIPLSSRIVIVSSAEHMYRSVRSFEKAGFLKVGSSAAFEFPPDEEDLKDKTKKTKKIQNLTLRYNVWSYMQYEIHVMREYTAIVYYWLNGWI